MFSGWWDVVQSSGRCIYHPREESASQQEGQNGSDVAALSHTVAFFGTDLFGICIETQLISALKLDRSQSDMFRYLWDFAEDFQLEKLSPPAQKLWLHDGKQKIFEVSEKNLGKEDGPRVVILSLLPTHRSYANQEFSTDQNSVNQGIWIWPAFLLSLEILIKRYGVWIVSCDPWFHSLQINLP